MIHQNHKKTVAIIGSGPAGLLATKYAKDYGFEPYAFQKNQQIGGVWNPQQGAVWKQMTLNHSKHSCAFFNFPWSEQAPIFPPCGQMFDYLNNYARHHDLLKHIKLNSEVVEVKRNGENNSYRISYKQNGQLKEEEFQYVIIASGMFTVPYIPKMEGLKDFKGKIMHSKEYKHGEEFKDKKVLVIGGSFTGIEIAANVSKYASKVVHSFTRPFWLLPHYQTENKLPIDFFYTREFYLAQPSKNAHLDKNQRLSTTICAQQQQFGQIRVPETHFQHPVYESPSSDYLRCFKAKKIVPYRSKIIRFQENKVQLTSTLENQEADNLISQDIDAIIFCTGYTTGLHYLSEEIQKIIEFDGNDRLQPFILYNEMYRPELKNMFFAGIYKVPYLSVIQLQIKSAFEYFTGNAVMPSNEEMEKQLQKQRSMRTRTIRCQFTHPDYVNFADSISKFAANNLEINKLISIAKDQTSSSQQRQKALKFFKMSVFSVVPHIFTTNNIDQQIQDSNKLIEDFVNSRSKN